METQNAQPFSFGELDDFGVMCQRAGQETEKYANKHSAHFVEWSRGESAQLYMLALGYMATVNEGLGTKNLVADAMREISVAIEIADALHALFGQSFYAAPARCTVAMILNDMITLGVPPLDIKMHLNVGDKEWLKDTERARDLAAGWLQACHEAQVVWSGGETARLEGMVVPGTAILSGSATGFLRSKELLMSPAAIMPKDVIILFGSTGPHANGLTDIRKAAARQKYGFATRLPNGQLFGEAVLAPTRLYVELIRRCQEKGARLHYGINITGHGSRKLMRAPGNFRYIVEKPGEVPVVFQAIKEYTGFDDETMYGNYNMGYGFAVICRPSQSSKVLKVSHELGIPAWEAGQVERAEEKSVHIAPLNLTYQAESLAIR